MSTSKERFGGGVLWMVMCGVVSKEKRKSGFIKASSGSMKFSDPRN